jgi:prolyl-tRNA synthetase
MTPTGESDGALLNFDQFDDFQIDLSHEMGDIYSSFNDPALPLTGIDEVDWAEVGKMFHLRD